MSVFKIECFVDDKKLGEVLRVLAGSGAMNVTPTPVGNAERARNGKVKTKYAGGNPAEMFMDHLRKHKIKSFRAQEIKTFLNELGAPSSSYSHHLATLRDRGLLRSTKGKGANKHLGLEWHVTDKGATPS